MMKICILTSVHPSFDTRIFHKEAKTLVKAGYDVTLIAQHDKYEIVDEVKIIPLNKPKNRIERMFYLTFKVLILSIRQKADIYHFHDPELLPIGVVLKILTNRKVIYDVHEDYGKQILSKQYLPRLTRKSIAFLTKIMEYLSSMFFDGIITATDDILDNFSYHKRAISVKNFPVSSNFIVSVDYFNANKQVFDLIYIGGLVEIRGIFQIVQALEFINSNRQVNLTLCGEFSPIDYEKKVTRLKGFRKVIYFGWIDPKKIPELLSRYCVGIVCSLPVPNFLKGMPIKLFEYMAAGLPVIASNFPLWREIVEGNNCGICVDPLDPKKIAEAIEYLIEHRDEAKRMGENGRRAVLEKYNWENESGNLLVFYKEVVKN